jgi:hypothetical protein
LIGGLLIEHRHRGKIVLITGVAQKLAAVSNQRPESSLTIPVYRAMRASSESSFVNDVSAGLSSSDAMAGATFSLHRVFLLLDLRLACCSFWRVTSAAVCICLSVEGRASEESWVNLRFAPLWVGQEF